MSDLANSCEYFTIDKSCSAVSESQKGKANRQIRCLNDEKATCCYVCSFGSICEIKCRFLGKIEGESPQTDAQKSGVDTAVNDKKTQVKQTENTSIACCSECNAKMSRTRTIFRIDGWEKSHLKPADEDTRKPMEELLPVTIYLCPRCGRIEFRANEK